MRIVELAGPGLAELQVEPGLHLPHGVGVDRAARRQALVGVPARQPLRVRGGRAGRERRSAVEQRGDFDRNRMPGAGRARRDEGRVAVGRIVDVRLHGRDRGCDRRRVGVVDARVQRAVRVRVVRHLRFPTGDRVRAEQRRPSRALRERAAREEGQVVGEVVVARREQRVAVLRRAHERPLKSHFKASITCDAPGLAALYGIESSITLYGWKNQGLLPGCTSPNPRRCRDEHRAVLR